MAPPPTGPYPLQDVAAKLKDMLNLSGKKKLGATGASSQKGPWKRWENTGKPEGKHGKMVKYG